MAETIESTEETVETPTEAPIESSGGEETVEPIAEDVVESVMDFESLEDDDELESTPVEAAPVPKAVEEPLVEEKVEEEVVPVEEEKVEAAPVEPTPPEAVKPPEPVEVKEPEPVEPQKSAEEMREDLRIQITENYKLTEEETELMVSDPASVLPSIAAKLHVNVYETVYHSIIAALGPMIQHTISNNTTQTSLKDSFYSAHPELNDPQYSKQLSVIGNAWRQAYPDATSEQAIEGIGKTAKAMFGIVAAAPETPKAEPAPKPIPPSVPSAAQVGSNSSPKHDAVDANAKMIDDIINFEHEDF